MAKILEATRYDLLRRSRKDSPERYLKRFNYQVANFRGVDLMALFNDDYFIFTAPIGDYIVNIAFPGVLTELRKIAKATRGDATKINLRMVTSALRIAFDKTDDIKVRCSCKDFHFRFMYYALKYDYLYGEPTPTTTDPPVVRNPNNDIGAVCKHLDVLLSNKRWLTKAASAVNDLIRTYPDKAAVYLYNEEDLPKEEPEEEPEETIETEVEVEETPENTTNEDEVPES